MQMFFGHRMRVYDQLFEGSTFLRHVSEKFLIDVIVQVGDGHFNGWRLTHIIDIDLESVKHTYTVRVIAV